MGYMYRQRVLCCRGCAIWRASEESMHSYICGPCPVSKNFRIGRCIGRWRDARELSSCRSGVKHKKRREGKTTCFTPPGVIPCRSRLGTGVFTTCTCTRANSVNTGLRHRAFARRLAPCPGDNTNRIHTYWYTTLQLSQTRSQQPYSRAHQRSLVNPPSSSYWRRGHQRGCAIGRFSARDLAPQTLNLHGPRRLLVGGHDSALRGNFSLPPRSLAY